MLGSAAALAPLPYLAGGRPAVLGGGRAPDGVFDVTDYGADPSGSTDSTDGFQKALDAVPAKGGVIVVPRGRYRICHTIVWPSVRRGGTVLKPALLQGQNPSVIKGVPGGWSEGISALEFTGSGPLFDLRLGDGAETLFSGGMADLAFHGSGTEGTTGVEAHRVSSAQFRNVVVRKFGVNFRVTGDSFYSVWESCLFSDAVTDGAQFRGQLNGSGFHRMRVAANGRHGISLERTGVPVYFDGCWFEANGSYGLSAMQTIHLHVVGCYFEGNEASGIRFQALEGGMRTGTVGVVGSYFRPVTDACCLELTAVPARARLVSCVVYGDRGPESVVRTEPGASHSLVALGGSRYGKTRVPLVNTDVSSFRDVVALGDDFARDDTRLGSSHVLRGRDAFRILDTPLEFPSMTVEERPTAGRPGRVVFDPEDGALKIDTGDEWVRFEGRRE
jgi:hypothetical protein